MWLYRGGFARFSNSRFSLDSIEDTCILQNALREPSYRSDILQCRFCDHPVVVDLNMILLDFFLMTFIVLSLALSIYIITPDKSGYPRNIFLIFFTKSLL